MLLCTLFEWESGGAGGGGSEKVYVLYTHLNVDNYEWSLSIHLGMEICISTGSFHRLMFFYNDLCILNCYYTTVNHNRTT